MKKATASIILTLLLMPPLRAAPPKASQRKPSQPTPAPTAIPAPTPTPALTPDQRIEAGAATIVDETGNSYVERIDWSEDTENRAPAMPEIRIYMAPKPWHRSPRSLKRDVVERIVKLDWRSCSWAERYSGAVFARVYVGDTFLGRIEVRDSDDSGRADRFQPSPAWADQ